MVTNRTAIKISCFIREHRQKKQGKMIGGFTDDPTGSIVAMIAMFRFGNLMLLAPFIAETEYYKHF